MGFARLNAHLLLAALLLKRWKRAPELKKVGKSQHRVELAKVDCRSPTGDQQSSRAKEAAQWAKNKPHIKATM